MISLSFTNISPENVHFQQQKKISSPYLLSQLIARVLKLRDTIEHETNEWLSPKHSYFYVISNTEHHMVLKQKLIIKQIKLYRKTERKKR